jgi:hypothetical protein
VFWLESKDRERLWKAVLGDRDSQAAKRLINYYEFSGKDYRSVLRLHAIILELDKNVIAARNIEVLGRILADKPELKSAFELGEEARKELEHRAKHNRDAKAAMRLAFYYGFSICDNQLKKYWLQTSADLGSNAAVAYLEYLANPKAK